MKRTGLKNPDVAKAAAVHETTVSRWRNDAQHPESAELEKVSALLIKKGLRVATPAWLRYGPDSLEARLERPVVSESSVRSYYQGARPRFENRLPPLAYARVYEHLEHMKTVSASIEQIEEAERLMIDGAFNKLNKRDIRVRTEEELITDIDAAWDFIRAVLRREGKKL